ncbi:hypothetical protein IKF76_00510, partial [Candidatus Saccharibacteria bacterium]|nr:hypothetical protein [Candidatus Saccharibacteria bacterium]
MEPDHSEQEYHPDPKAAATIHDSGAELENIVSHAAKKQDVTLDATQEGVAVPKRKGKIIALITAVIVLVCGIGALVFFLIWRNNPEVVAMDAVVNYLNTDTIRTSGHFATEVDNYNFTGKVTFAFDGEARGLNHKMSG